MKFIETSKAPKAIGPYSQAIVSGPLLFCSGQIPVNPATGEFAGTDIETQTEQSLKNMHAILTEAGYTMQNVLKTTVFLKDMGSFAKMNAVYERMFEGHRPARSTVEVARLPKDCLVEIECVASKP